MSNLPPLEISTLKNKIQELKNLQTTNRIEKESRSSEIHKQERTIEKLKNDINKLKARIKKLKNPQNPQLSDEIATNEKNEMLKVAISEVKEKIREAKETKKELDSKNTQIRISLQDIQDHLEAENVPYEMPPEIVQKQKEIELLEKKRFQLQEQNFNLHDPSSLKTYQVSLDDQISVLNQQNEEKLLKVAELRQSLSKLQHQVQEMKTLTLYKSKLSDEEARTIQLKSALNRLSLLAQQCHDKNLV